MILNKTVFSAVTLSLTLSLGLLGCGGDDSASTDTSGNDGNRINASAEVPGDLFLDQAPEGATPVEELRASAKEGDEVVMDVIVGGDVNPIVDGRAVMFVVDSKVPNRCTSDDDHCETPWDYCCDWDAAQAGKATVQVVDADGRPLKTNLGNGVGPLARLTVVGTIGPRPSNETLIVNATGIYVQQPAQ